MPLTLQGARNGANGREIATFSASNGAIPLENVAKRLSDVSNVDDSARYVERVLQIVYLIAQVMLRSARSFDGMLQT